jgi:hypothetical protein
VFNFNSDRADRIQLSWSDLGLTADKPVHVFDFWNREYLGAWEKGMVVETAPTSCRVLTLLPDDGGIQFISSSRHITQGWLDLASLTKNEAGTAFSGTSKVVKNDPYELRFVFPRGTNYVAKRAVAKSGALKKLPVTIANHQGWAAITFTAPKTSEVKWEIEFEPAGRYDYPPSPPENVTARRVGLDGATLAWREQYYLNAGYQVYLDGVLHGYTPTASYPLTGLDPRSNYTAQVKTVWDDGHESPRGGQVKFTLAEMIPASMSLTSIEPVRSTGRWRGYEIDEMLSAGPLAIGTNTYDQGLSSFANAEAEFDLKGLFDTFSATIGVDKSSGSGTNATIEFFVVGDGKELWNSGQMKSGDEPKSFEIEINGVKTLTLRTTGGGGGRRSRAQADWIEPKVSRK